MLVQLMRDEKPEANIVKLPFETYDPEAAEALQDRSNEVSSAGQPRRA